MTESKAERKAENGAGQRTLDVWRPKSSDIPAAPGVYLFRDKDARVIYVGKALSLRHRVPNYFNNELHPRTATMVAAARLVEWIVTANEVEALQLEVTLIKQHQPRFNVRYRDDKSYPYLTVTYSEDIPRAMVTRGPKRKGNRYYGPYTHAYAIRETLDLLLKVFSIRSCSQGVFDRARRAKRPCLLFHIGRCSGPCVGEVSPDEHRRIVDQLCNFMDGDHEPVLRELRQRMERSAAGLEFEQAARARDQLTAVRRVLERQEMVTEKGADIDAIAFSGDSLEAAFQTFFIRRGRVVGRKGFMVDRVEDLTDEELVGSFLETLYSDGAQIAQIPKEVLVPSLPPLHRILEDWLSERKGSRVGIRVPQRGSRKALLGTIETNAKEAFIQNRLKRAADFVARSKALKQLQSELDLPEAPLRIECFDISNLGPTEVVGAMVVFEDGLPKKSDYRKFKIRGVEGQDDVASMGEVVRRRFSQMLKEQSSVTLMETSTMETSPDATPKRLKRFSYSPGLVVIDGGKGQLNRAVDVMSELGVVGIPVVSLAKRLEEVFLPGQAEPRIIPRGSEALYLLQRVRDEAHRFAITYQRSRRQKRMTESVLDGLPGLGPVRRQALFRHFGSATGVSKASLQEIQAVDGIGRGLAVRIYDYIRT
ncbi:MAG: excinuclease ABC subunit UvrC [Actinomycetota bacterium]